MEVDQELAHIPFISGLPDDLAMLYLAKVPRSYHHNLRRVSKRWKQMVCSKEWLLYRRMLKLDEPWIYAICEDSVGICLYVLDPSSKRWKRLRKLPPLCQNKHGISSQAIGNKLYILGFTGSRKVYCYDTAADSFGETRSRPSSRSCVTCEVVNGKLYVIGTKHYKCTRQLVWETFDPNVNEWTTWESDVSINTSKYDSLTHGDKIYILPRETHGGLESMLFHPPELMFHPADGGLESMLMLQPAISNKWEPVFDDDYRRHWWPEPTVLVNGTLYGLKQYSGLTIVMRNEEEDFWVTLGKLSTHRVRPPCRLVAAGMKIYVISSTLHTVVIDLNTLGNVPGTLVSSYAEGCDDVRATICCTTASL